MPIILLKNLKLLLLFRTIWSIINALSITKGKKMNKIDLNIIDIIKIICIIIIGSSNATTFALFFYKVFENKVFTIASVVLMFLATVTGLIIFFVNKIAKSKRKANETELT